MRCSSADRRLWRRGLICVWPRLYRRYPAVFYVGGQLGSPDSRNAVSTRHLPPLDVTVSPSSLPLSPPPARIVVFPPTVGWAKPQRPEGAAGGVQRPEGWGFAGGKGKAISAPRAEPSPPARSAVCSTPPSPRPAPAWAWCRGSAGLGGRGMATARGRRRAGGAPGRDRRGAAVAQRLGRQRSKPARRRGRPSAPSPRPPLLP